VRERLLSRLDRAAGYRLTSIVADAGFGKTVLLQQWLSRPKPASVLVCPVGREVAGLAAALVAAVRDVAPEVASRLAMVVEGIDEGERSRALAGMICAALADLPDLDVLFVVDDVHLLEGPAGRFVEALVRQAPTTLHMILLGRQALPFSVERLPEDVQVLTGRDLGLDDAELSDVMIALLGDDTAAEPVKTLLGRWPAAVRLAAETLASQPLENRASALASLQRHGAADLKKLAMEVLDSEPPLTRRLLQLVAPYDSFTVELAEALGCGGASVAIQQLHQRGIVTALGGGRFALPQLLREFLRRSLPVGREEQPELARAAGLWFEQQDDPVSALRCALGQGDSAWVARLLHGYGQGLLFVGRASAVGAALEVVDPGDLDDELRELQVAVHVGRHDADAALKAYQRLREDGRPISPWLACQLGLLLYQRGDLDLALTVLETGVTPVETPDYALMLAWRATVQWARGHADRGLAAAEEALAVADRLADPRALAAAHTALALLAAHRGDRDANRTHYSVALKHAAAAGDVQQVVRIRNNLGSRLLEEGELQASLAELEGAIELAEASGQRFYLSLALANRGELRLHLGQYDAAVADLEAARNLDADAASPGASSALVHLGHLYRHRGNATQAQQAYEEAVAAGRQAGDVNLLVPALCGMAQLLASTNPERAQELADEALSHDPGMGRVTALLTAAWLANDMGRPDRVARLAREAELEARRRRDRIGLAEALYLAALADPVQQTDDPRLTEAEDLLVAVGAPVWLAFVRLERARRDPSARQTVREVAELAEQVGARKLAERAAEVGRAHDAALSARVEIVTLGGFRVRRSGKAMGLSEWPDDSARAVVERLSARASWPRFQLARSLSPALDASAADEHLERALTGARQALDPDGLLPADHYLAATHDTVALRNVEVDVHTFMAEAARGLAAVDGRDLLRSAEARYGGDFLEEHPGQAWADGLREEARTTYVEVTRALAADAAEGQPEAAARYSRRILERDPYDEKAHLTLVAALRATGRLTEARRCYTTYAQRLDELGLEALPWGVDPATEGVSASS